MNNMIDFVLKNRLLMIVLGVLVPRIELNDQFVNYFDESIAGPMVVRAEECLQLLDKADSYLEPYLEHEKLGEEATQQLALTQLAMPPPKTPGKSHFLYPYKHIIHISWGGGSEKMPFYPVFDRRSSPFYHWLSP